MAAEDRVLQKYVGLVNKAIASLSKSGDERRTKNEVLARFEMLVSLAARATQDKFWNVDWDGVTGEISKLPLAYSGPFSERGRFKSSVQKLEALKEQFRPVDISTGSWGEDKGGAKGEKFEMKELGAV